MRTVETDVLVIGSGFGAAPAALRLADVGLRVIVLEKGPRINPYSDFRQTQDPKYLLRYLHGMSGRNLSLTYAEALGGGSGFYEMVSLRAPSRVFEHRDENSHRVWPRGLTRHEFDSYYDIAEEKLHVEQIQPNLVPKTGLVFSKMMKNLGYSCERARYAVRGCVGSGFCVTGCIYGAKQSLLLNYLPQAVSSGAVVETELEAKSIHPINRRSSTGPLEDLPLRYEVRCRRGAGIRERIRYRAKILVLAGGTVGTAKLLLRSSRYLSRLSNQTGRNIAFNGSVKTAGILPEGFPEGDMFSGRSHPGMISYEFLDSHGITISAAKPLPLQVVASARLRVDGDGEQPLHWGRDHVELMRLYRTRMMVLVAFGMTPPLGQLTHVAGDNFDLELPLTDGLREYYRETKHLLHDIMLRNGCSLVDAQFVDREGSPHRDLHFSTAHQVGACRMADSRSYGTCDVNGEVFGYPGMFITDGAAIPSSLSVNTSLTILANAERIVSGIARRYAPSALSVSAASASG